MQCKGFLFDPGETLIDSSPAVERAWHNWVDRFGFDHAEVLGFIYGKQTITSLRHFMVGKSETEIAAGFIRSEQIEATEITGIIALPGATDLLNHLNKAGVPWAIATSGFMLVAQARHCVAGFPALEVLVIAEWVKRGKPEPDAYLLGVQLPGLVSQECAMVEDASVGVLSGLAAGCHVIAINAPADMSCPDEVDFSLTSLERTSVTKQSNGNVAVTRNT